MLLKRTLPRNIAVIVDLDTVGQNPVGLNDVEVYDVDTIQCRTYYVYRLDLNL